VVTVTESKKITLRLDLDERLSKKFLRLKKKIGLKANSETVRYLIQRVYEDEGLEFMRD